MINGKIEQFLDTGWYSEATIYFNGYIYWCEAQSNDGEITFFVDKWKAQNENDTYYHSIFEKNGILKWNRAFEIKGNDIDYIKQEFLKTPIFEGKTFWEVENTIAWLEESTPICAN